MCCGCSDYLDEKPEGMLTEEQAFSNLTLLKNNALLSIYNYIGGNASSQGLQGTDRGVYDLNSLTTDEQIIPIRSGDWEDGYLWFRLFQHTWSSDEEPFINTWNYLFKVIVMTNEGIERMENYKKGHSEDKVEVDSYIAELRALRAMFYFYAMDLWGRVPLLTSTSIKTSDMTLSDRLLVHRERVAGGTTLPRTHTECYVVIRILRTHHVPCGRFPSGKTYTQRRGIL